MKNTKVSLSNDIVKYSGLAANLIEEIKEIMGECKNLTGQYRDLSVELILKYEKPFKDIEAANWKNFSRKKPVHYTRTFNKPYLQDFVNRLERDIEILSNISNTLLEVINDSVKAECNTYKEYNIYDENNKWLDSGNFKDVYSAVEATTKSLHIFEGKFNIVGNGEIATFKVNKKDEIYDLEVNPLKNTIQVTCDTIHDGQWIHTIYQTTPFNIDTLMLGLKTNRNVKNLSKPEPIPTKEYQYTYKFRGYSPGCQPRKGFIRWEKHDMFKFEVVIYDRKLTDKEINEYELKALN